MFSIHYKRLQTDDALKGHSLIGIEAEGYGKRVLMGLLITCSCNFLQKVKMGLILANQKNLVSF